MPLDPDAQAHIDLMKDRVSVVRLTPAEARAGSKAARGLVPRPQEAVFDVSDGVIPTPDGEIKTRIYSPESDTATPALVYFHGGGWVVGDLESCDPVCRQLCNRTGMKVISVDYRLAPEFPFPCGLNDGYEAFLWVRSQAERLHIDAERIGIGGDSSGGNVAAGIALRLRDESPIRPAFQLLVYPVTYASLEAGDYDKEHNTPMLSDEGMAWYSSHYVVTARNSQNPYASPLQAGDVAGLPPTILASAGRDVLRSQIESYRDRLRSAGVPVTALHYEELFHGFFGLSGILARSTVAMDEIALAVSDMLNPAATR